jgi:hypothetical protein
MTMGDDEHEDHASLDGEGLDGGSFFNPHGKDPWYSRLREDPNKPRVVKWPPNAEAQDERQWGNVATLTLAVPALGTFPTPLVQLVQLTRQAKVWSVSLQWSVLEGDVTPVTEFVRAVFVVTLGIGQSSTRIFREFDKAALQTFLGNPPTVNTIIPDLPARQVLVQGMVEWRTVVGAGNTIHSLQAAVAPVVR